MAMKRKRRAMARSVIAVIVAELMPNRVAKSGNLSVT